MWMVFITEKGTRMIWYGDTRVDGRDKDGVYLGVYLGISTQSIIETSWRANAREFHVIEFGTCQIIASGRW